MGAYARAVGAMVVCDGVQSCVVGEPWVNRGRLKHSGWKPEPPKPEPRNWWLHRLAAFDGVGEDGFAGELEG